MQLDENLFPQKLKQCRKHMGMRQDEFAKLMGYTTQYISCLETGRRNPSTKFLLNLSSQVKRPLSFFYTDLLPLSQTNPQLFETLCNRDESELVTLCNTLEIMCYGIFSAKKLQ